jgi:hypothetical protein
MSTRSRIAIENQDGSVTSIYCHFDGYISGVGKTLEKHYTDRSVVEELIELGDLSALGMSPSSTSAYTSNRNEDLHTTSYLCVEDLFNLGFQSGEEYVYCFTKNNIWLVNEDGSNQVNDLKVVLEEEGV